MANNFSTSNREQAITEVKETHFDLLIIGGGITGSGIALDAATRGLKTAVIEMQDFAAGTSSRSTKLVHGGLRYLKQLQVGVVAETGKERAVVYENGPHVTTPEWMMLPFHEGGTFGKFSTSIGLKVYDFLANVKRGERRTMFSVEETIKREPLIKRNGLKGSGYYVEYRTDDARLTIEVMKEAVNQGAIALNYTKAESFLYENEKLIGLVAKDVLTNETYRICAKKIVNATGPWVDNLREKDQSKRGKYLQLSKGVHLVFDRESFPLQQAIYFDTQDGRMMFAIPRDGKTYVGTTDTFYNDEPVSPKVTAADQKYILEAIAYMFPNIKITADQIESSWAGVRPLIYQEGKSASEISRKDEVWMSPSGLITIAGGKLTGYRHMAEKVVDDVMRQLTDRQWRPCQTKHLPISGGKVGGSVNFEKYIKEKAKIGVQIGLEKETAEQLAKFYGSNIETVFDYCKQAQERFEHLPSDIGGRLLYAIHEEMTVTPIDFFMRRTGASLFNINWVYEWKERIIDTMSEILNWSDEKKEQYSNELDIHLQECCIQM